MANFDGPFERGFRHAFNLAGGRGLLGHELKLSRDKGLNTLYSGPDLALDPNGH